MKNIILGTYFVSKTDQQRNTHAPKDSFEYIAHWYTSITRLNLNAILFYDNLSDWFIKRYENKNIRFVKTHRLKYGLYEERFLIYFNYLKNNLYDAIFFTDVQDLWFAKDPFKLINNRYKIYVGVENSLNKDNSWMIKRYKLTYGDIPQIVSDKPVLNVGILGGKHTEIIKLLSKFNKEFAKFKIKNIKVPIDMVLFNYLIYKNYSSQYIYCGKRLNSPYKLYLKSGNFAIFHK